MFSAIAVVHTTSKVLISEYDRAARNHSANLHHLQRDEGVPHPQPRQNDERCLESRLRNGFLPSVCARLLRRFGSQKINDESALHDTSMIGSGLCCSFFSLAMGLVS